MPAFCDQTSPRICLVRNTPSPLSCSSAPEPAGTGIFEEQLRCQKLHLHHRAKSLTERYHAFSFGSASPFPVSVRLLRPGIRGLNRYLLHRPGARSFGPRHRLRTNIRFHRPRYSHSSGIGFFRHQYVVRCQLPSIIRAPLRAALPCILPCGFPPSRLSAFHRRGGGWACAAARYRARVFNPSAAAFRFLPSP